MHIQLGHLKPGTYRNLSEGELERLQHVLKNSSGLPAAVEKQRKRELVERQTAGAAGTGKRAENRTGVNHGKERANRRTGRTVK